MFHDPLNLQDDNMMMVMMMVMAMMMVMMMVMMMNIVTLSAWLPQFGRPQVLPDLQARSSEIPGWQNSSTRMSLKLIHPTSLSECKAELP